MKIGHGKYEDFSWRKGMKARFILIGIIIILCTWTINIGYAVTPKYATPSHPDITEISIKYFKSNGGNLLVNVLDQDIIKMREGSSHEDSGVRSLNHYYDFLYGSGYLDYDSSKIWVHNSVKQSGKTYGGDHTWEAAVNSYKAGDISTAFYHLGHVVHLIQDLTVPAHARDDGHAVGTIDYDNIWTWPVEYEDWIKNKINSNGTNILNSMLNNSNMLEFDSLDNYFDYLSNYTQRSFYSGDSVTGTVFKLKYSENGTKETIFPGYSNPHAEQFDGEAYYFVSGKDPDGTGEVRLAYRAYIFPVTGFEIWSAEHPAIYEDTWQRAGKLAMRATAGVVNLFLKEVVSNAPPGTISVSPSSGSWTTTPQNLAVSSSGATAIYYTMVNTTDGSVPVDPREPTLTDNDGSFTSSGGVGTLQLHGSAGQYKRSKLRFRGYSSAVAGPTSVVYSYSIDLRSTSMITVSDITAGYENTLALKNDGTVWAWGGNEYGQLGSDPSDANAHPTPAQVSGLTGVMAIAGGNSSGHILALKNDGTVWAWGLNKEGELGNGTTSFYDANPTPLQVSGLTGVTAVAAGSGHSIALKNDGTVWAWGGNFAGQLGDGTNNSRTIPVQVSGLTGVTAIAAGNHYSIALKNDGTVWMWGSSYYAYGVTPFQVSGLTGVTAIAGGYEHTLALKNDGTVWAWGRNTGGELGVEVYVHESYTPVQTSGLNGVTAIEAGYQHSIALKNDGTVWAWGWNGCGQLGFEQGVGGWTSYTPVQVSGMSSATAIAAGHCHSIALKNDGTVWAWGDNWRGQLGVVTPYSSSSTPVEVSGL
jgi:alpha-tubulin suppressor-like RCC1 family protein